MARMQSIPWAVCALISLGGTGLAESDERFPGTWQSVITAGSVRTTLHVIMLADGTFTTVIEGDAGEMRIYGSYRVVDAQTIRFTNRDFTPREQCATGADGKTACTKVEIPAEETDGYAFERNGQTLVISNPEAGEIRYERVE